MAYQPKSYRKFVATAATATLVASAVAPAAAAGFSDVSERYAESVNYLVENNIASGLTATTFGVSKEVKRVDAAVMLAKALGLDGADAPDAGFGDVPDRAKDAVNALKAAGFINGKTATSFGSDAPLTRGELAIILSNAYSLTGEGELTFSDVNDRYAAAVKALVANEITSGKTATSFGTSDAVKRGEFAIFLHKADTLVAAPMVTGISSIDSTHLLVTVKGEVSEISKEDFAFDGGLEVVAAEIVTEGSTADEEKFTSIKLTTSTQEAGKTYNLVSFLGKKVTEGPKVEVPATPMVTEVSANNVRVITVSFNKALDSDTVTTANFAIDNNVTTSNVVLSADKKTVHVVAGANLTDGKEYKLTVKNVKDSAGTAVASTDKTFKPVDAGIPTIKSVTALGATTLRVEFSEPVQTNISTAGNFFEIDEAAITATATAVDATNTAFNVVLSAPIAAGEHKIKNKGTIQDYAGYVVPIVEQKFTVSNDTAVPSVSSIEVVNQRQIKVTFNKQINLGEATDYSANFAFSEYSNGAARYAADSTNTVDAVDSSKTSYYVNFNSNPLPAGKKVYFLVDGDGSDSTVDLKDFSSNPVKNSEWVLTGDVVAEATAKVTEAKSASDSSVTVYFDKPMNATEVVKATNYELKDADGDDVITTNGSYTANTDGKGYRVTFTLASVQPTGTYEVTYKNLKDGLGNTLADGKVSVSIVDSTTPSISAAYGTSNSSTYEQVLYVDFSENMSFSGANSVLNTAKYEFEVDGSGTDWAQPTNHTIEAYKVNDKRVKLVIKPKAGVTSLFLSDSDFDVRLGLVADAEGNVIPTYITKETINLNAHNDVYDLNNSATQLKAVDLVAANKVQIKVAGKFEAITTGDFVVYNAATTTYANVAALNSGTAGANGLILGQTKAEASYSSTTGLTTFTLTLAKDVDLVGDSVYVAVSPNPTAKDVAGIGFTADEVLNPGGTAAVAAANKIAPQVVRASLVDTDTIAVEFDDSMAAVLASDFVVTKGTDTKNLVKTAVATGQYDGATVWYFDIDNTDVNVTDLKLSVKESAQSAKAGNYKLAKTETAIDVKNFGATATTITNEGTSGLDANAAKASADSFKFTFDTALDATSIGTFTSGVLTAATTATLAQNASAADTLTVGNLGVISFNDETVNASNEAVTAAGTTKESYKLEMASDEKSVTLWYTDLGTTAAAIDDTAFTVITFKTDAGLKTKSGYYFNVDKLVVNATGTGSLE
ncbi:S-layer homology domain-containing protein [Cytobacillus spongiae]|uniref:S-layer homology domain-containing protein n=1 Tax=Cytobacillus spongiae TaxID=2901381 RepID=UPI001F2C60A4|nr:S-layer homology domain-containing protein [Cytobacillus spongiae]UII55683.1 S-layer homology domain-containing protein [Cytobacillus spongiae]